jgi:hypothetical protein
MTLLIVAASLAVAQDFPSPVGTTTPAPARESAPVRRAGTVPPPRTNADVTAELRAAKSELEALRARVLLLESDATSEELKRLIDALAARVSALEAARSTAAAAPSAAEVPPALQAPGEPSAAAPPERDAPPAEAPAVRVSGSLGWASAYVFRGYNAFGGGVTGEQDGLWNASSRADHRSGAWVSWWGGMQASGDDIDANVDAVWGGEQDLVLGWDRALGRGWTGTVSGTAMIYPLAAPSVSAPGQVPVYAEPAVILTHTDDTTTFGTRASWLYGVQDELAAYRYVYVGANGLRTTDLGDGWFIDVGASLNAKLGAPEAFGDANRIDGSLDATVRHPLSRRATFAPGLHVVCTDEPTHVIGCTPWANVDLRVGP